MWKFYILYSFSKDTYYIGFRGDVIEDKIRKHNANHKGFIGSVGDRVLKYSEIYNTKVEVCKRELQVKKWKSRKLIEELIAFGSSSA